MISAPSPVKASSGGAEAHIAFLDHLRGLAIFLVFFHHAAMTAYPADTDSYAVLRTLKKHFSLQEAFLYIPSLGTVGVPIFFVISGFCIHLSHVRSRETGFKTFFLRRFFRIYPPYLGALLFFAFVFPTTRTTFQSWHDFGSFFSHLFLVHNLQPFFSPAGMTPWVFGFNGSFWSIAVEVQLYVIYPLLYFLYRGVGWKRCLWIVFAVSLFFMGLPSLLFRLWPHSGWDFSVIARTPFVFWFSWSIGAVVADDWMARRTSFFVRFPLWLGPVLFAGSCWIPILDRFSFTFAALSTAVFIGWLLARPTPVLAKPNPLTEHFRLAGLVSYGAYLLHQPLLIVLPGLASLAMPSLSIHRSLVFALCLLEWPLVLLISWFFYRLVELPSIALGKVAIRSVKAAGHSGPTSVQVLN